MESLAVLMRYEGASTEDNKLIIKELYDNAKLNLFVTSSLSRTMSLAILNHLCEIEPISINKLIENQINLIANCDWYIYLPFHILQNYIWALLIIITTQNKK